MHERILTSNDRDGFGYIMEYIMQQGRIQAFLVMFRGKGGGEGGGEGAGYYGGLHMGQKFVCSIHRFRPFLIGISAIFHSMGLPSPFPSLANGV